MMEPMGWFWRYDANDIRPQPSAWWFTKENFSPEYMERWNITRVPAFGEFPDTADS
jgi:hypothetical protein